MISRALRAAICAAGTILVSGPVAAGVAASKAVDLPASVDRVVIRGSWIAHVGVGIGPPRLTILADARAMRSIAVSNDGSLVTLRQTGALPATERLEVRMTLPRLRGLATSGSVTLAIADRSETNLFLDISGVTTVRASGSVPALRVTTSGASRVDLAKLIAGAVRVHARQSSRLTILAVRSLTIVALNDARVTYVGPPGTDIVRTGSATIVRIR